MVISTTAPKARPCDEERNNMFRIQGFAAVCVSLWMVCSSFAQEKQKEHSPHLVVYDATRLKNYSTNELIDLLSSASLEKNARATGNGFLYLSPPDRRQVESTADPKLYAEMKIDPHATDYTLSVEQEIVRRRPYKNLSDTFARTTDVIQLE